MRPNCALQRTPGTSYVSTYLCGQAPLNTALGVMTKSYDKSVAPFGWYVGSYLLRFIEIDSDRNEDPEARFLTWENTVLVNAKSLDEAYDKIDLIGREHSEPYKGGPDGIDVQWAYEGVTQILPVYEEIEDGAEIIWSERNGVKLKNIRASVRQKGTFGQ